MKEFSAATDPVLAGKGLRFRLSANGEPLSFAQALDSLSTSPHFRDHLTTLIVQSDFHALRWETPPITTVTLGRAFEFALVDDPFLDMEPEPDVFGPYFERQPPDADVLAVWNLGRTAKLVVPRQIGDPRAYVHLNLEAAVDRFPPLATPHGH